MLLADGLPIGLNQELFKRAGDAQNDAFSVQEGPVVLHVAVRGHLNQYDLLSYEANQSHILLTLDSDEALLSHARVAHDLNVTVIVETFADSEHEVRT